MLWFIKQLSLFSHVRQSRSDHQLEHSVIAPAEAAYTKEVFSVESEPHMEKLSFLLLLATLSSSITICSTDETKAVGAALAQFTEKLYAKINEKNAESNIIFSPASIALALALLEAGAAGTTRADLRNVLMPINATLQIHSAYGELMRQVEIEQNETYLNIANNLFYGSRINLSANYSEKIKESFETELEPVVFAKTEATRQKINAWVSNATAEKIPELFKPGVINAGTVAVLASAIYLKSSWRRKFAVIGQRAFHPFGKEDQKKMVTFFGRIASFPYASNDEVEMVEIPYYNDSLAMYVIKAKAKKTSIQTVESTLSGDNILRLFENTTSKSVDLKLPVFSIRLPMRMKEIFIEMGLGRIFTDEADFSEMDPAGGLKVDKIVHEAYIKVNENGTEAAAATGVTAIGRTPADGIPEAPIPFIADYPFVFSIVHKPSSAILFHGKVNVIKDEK